MITAEQEKRHRQGWKPEEVRGGGLGWAGERQQREDNVKKYKVAAENGKKNRKCCGRGNWRHKKGKMQDFCLQTA